MRNAISGIFMGLGVVCALVAAGCWMYFIWSLDWGHFGSRAWGLWFFFVFLMGTMIIAVAAAAPFLWMADRTDRGS